MSLKKIVGLETEYGIHLEGQPKIDHEELSGMLVQAYVNQIISSAKSKFYYKKHCFDCHLPNGARFYVDHGHPEYSTPECGSLLDLIAADKAGERILHQVSELVNQQLNGPRISIFKNNTDYKGHSYGCHENYLVEAKTFESVLQSTSELLHKHFLPFLVTRQIYAGAGKAGSENMQPNIEYQISQRADFFETILGLQTTYKRPIVNTRDEPHADPRYFRRLHVIIGDANLCETAIFLKVGTTQLILRMLEDKAKLPDLCLMNPVAALQQISHDTDLQQTIELSDGRTITSLEIQLEFWNAAVEYLKDQPIKAEEQEVLTEWQLVLQSLVEAPERLIGKIDWITKKYLIESFRQKTGESWYSPLVRELDIKYHNIDPSGSHFYLLKQAGLIEKKVSDDLIIQMVGYPPDNTRAYLRGTAIQRLPNISAVDWSYLELTDRKISLSDPRIFQDNELMFN